MKRLILAGLACVLLGTGSANAEDAATIVDGIHRITCSGPLRKEAVHYFRVGDCEASEAYPEVIPILLKGCIYLQPCVVDASVILPEGPGNAIIMHVYSLHPGK
jgi:hypothetical protein